MASFKPFVAAGVIVFAFLALATTFVSWAPWWAEAGQYFTPEEIQRSEHYGFEVWLFFWAATCLHLGFLTTLVATSWGRRWADACQRWAGGRWLLGIVLLLVCLVIAEQLLMLPIGIARLHHRRAWGLTDRSLVAWLSDRGKGLVETLVREGIVIVGFFLLARRYPRRWWLPAAAGATVFVVLYIFIKPIVIDPWFNTFTPLSQTQWKDLEPRVHALIHKAGVPVEEILVVDASRQSTHSNAYFTGFGSTRRIVLYDNLLMQHPPAEVESILAHELGHWLHHHIVQGTILAAGGFVVGFWLLAKILEWLRDRAPLRLRSAADPAALPVLMLMGALGNWAIAPVQNAVSRHFERQADTVALDLAGQPDVFIEAEKRLAVKNLGRLLPTPWEVWLFNTHPPVLERIGMAEAWKKTQRE
jgi:STE24 endopeptidase